MSDEFQCISIEFPAAKLSLKASPDMSLNVELIIEPHVYLHEAELVQRMGIHGCVVPQAYKDEHSVIWRQVEIPSGGACSTAFAVSWVTVANVTPGVEYWAILRIRDSKGHLLEGENAAENPRRVRGKIGPVSAPIDAGRLAVRRYL